jgi:ferrous iron transport protein B
MTTAAAPAKPLLLALVGNPNSGKTTIFNALTGLRQKTGNYPGVTVEKRLGRCTLPDGGSAQIIDLPGTYSLIARSPDERVTVDVLAGRSPGLREPDAAIVVVDASNLQRNLYLVTQLIEMRLPMVIALNMTDIARRRGVDIAAGRLAEALGVPVVPVVGTKRTGIDRLKAALSEAAVAPEPVWPLDEAMRRAVDELAAEIGPLADANHLSPHAAAERLLCDEPLLVSPDAAVRSRVELKRNALDLAGVDPIAADVEAHYEWIESVAARAAVPKVATGDAVLPYSTTEPTLSERVDRFLLNPWLGLIAFSLVMIALFVSVFYLADPLMGATEDGIGKLGGFIGDRIGEGILHDLWTDGIVAGVGGVLVFVPQIAILFLFLATLEDSGYLARAAFLMDRVLGKVGLNGKSFIPMLSSFACAIPGVMAARTIENRRERLATIFVAPFMGCSARIPVYVLLISTFFAGFGGFTRGLIMFACYALGVVAAVATAWVWKLWTVKQPRSTFILELPSYKFPTPAGVLRVMLRNTWAFVRKAGTIIFALSVILWALAYWPQRSPQERDAARAKGVAVYVTSHEAEAGSENFEAARDAAGDQAAGAEQLRNSYAGKLGHLIQPVIKPLGFDWKIGVGLIGSFAAREVFVSTMGIVYGAGDDEEDTAPLSAAMTADTWPDGKPVWTPLVAVSCLVWFVIAMQCMSTVAVVKRETGKWSWALGQLVYMNALAYVLCLLIFQIGRHFV